MTWIVFVDDVDAYLINIQYDIINIDTAQEGNMGNFYRSKTNINLGFASVDIGFRGVTISHVTLSCSQNILYNTEC